jgi:2-polyprenyl-3-methyl-5-hydroxy-6-metoxy-1,4-benzoquinol methylase
MQILWLNSGMTQSSNLNQESQNAWEANAGFWDARMGDEGNDFFQILQWPVIASFIDPQPAARILDIACGNGLTSRKLAEFGTHVTAFDFSTELINLAKSRVNPDGRIIYQVLDATDESALVKTLSPSAPFDSALCNMALFDMAEIKPLFRALQKLLNPGSVFVFSLTHPAFNNSSSVHVIEEVDYEGEFKTVYSVKISRYMSSYQARGLAMREQPAPQPYFERPLHYYLNAGFENGFVLDGFEERAFPPGHPFKHPLSWGGQFSEIRFWLPVCGLYDTTILPIHPHPLLPTSLRVLRFQHLCRAGRIPPGLCRCFMP